MGTKAAIRDVGARDGDPTPRSGPGGKTCTVRLWPRNHDEGRARGGGVQGDLQQAAHLREVIDIAAKMEGTVRNAGTHAAGVVIRTSPFWTTYPLHRPTSGAEDMPIKSVTQFEMGILESLGMLKVDFLGLITLTVMARAWIMPISGPLRAIIRFSKNHRSLRPEFPDPLRNGRHGGKQADGHLQNCRQQRQQSFPRNREQLQPEAGLYQTGRLHQRRPGRLRPAAVAVAYRRNANADGSYTVVFDATIPQG